MGTLACHIRLWELRTQAMCWDQKPTQLTTQQKLAPVVREYGYRTKSSTPLLFCEGNWMPSVWILNLSAPIGVRPSLLPGLPFNPRARANQAGSLMLLKPEWCSDSLSTSSGIRTQERLGSGAVWSQAHWVTMQTPCASCRCSDEPFFSRWDARRN